MSDELKAQIEKEADDKYPINPFTRIKDMVAREAYIAGATAYAEKLEAIRAEVEGRKHTHYLSSLSSRTQIDECIEILSIIDKRHGPPASDRSRSSRTGCYRRLWSRSIHKVL